MKGTRIWNVIFNANNNTNSHRTNEPRANKEDLEVGLTLWHRQAMQQEELEGGNGLYMSSNSLNNASDLPKLAIQDDIETMDAQQYYTSYFALRRLMNGYKDAFNEIQRHIGGTRRRNKWTQITQANKDISYIWDRWKDSIFWDDGLHYGVLDSDVEEATGERPGLGRHARLHFFSEMIRSCLRGIGPGGCVLLIKQRSASKYSNFVVSLMVN